MLPSPLLSLSSLIKCSFVDGSSHHVPVIPTPIVDIYFLAACVSWSPNQSPNHILPSLFRFRFQRRRRR